MPTVTACSRCGTCCLKGGPALHHADLRLLHGGDLCRENLCTLRLGEPVFDQIRNAVVLLDCECIKIRSDAGNTACRFYRASHGGCSIYPNRPEECVALNCRDTSVLAAVSSSRRLSRLDIVQDGSALGALIREHEAQCGCADLLQWLRLGSAESLQCLNRAAAFDGALRAVVAERTDLGSEELLFLFGRPLPDVIKGLEQWLELERRQERKNS